MNGIEKIPRQVWCTYVHQIDLRELRDLYAQPKYQETLRNCVVNIVVNGEISVPTLVEWLDRSKFPFLKEVVGHQQTIIVRSAAEQMKLNNLLQQFQFFNPVIIGGKP